MANVGNISLFKKKETDEILYPYTHRDAVLNDDGSNPFDELKGDFGIIVKESLTQNDCAVYNKKTNFVMATSDFPGVKIDNLVVGHTYRFIIMMDITINLIFGLLPPDKSRWKFTINLNLIKDVPSFFDITWNYDANLEFAANARGDYYLAVFDITDIDIEYLENFNFIPEFGITLNTPLNVYTKEEVNDLINKKTTKVINCFGDSLTQGAGSNINCDYPSVLSSLISGSYTVNNYGVGGEHALSIGMRQGGMPLYVNPFTIPADTSVEEITFVSPCEYPFDTLIHQRNVAMNPCTISGVEGSITFSNDKYYFARSASGEVKNITRPVKVITSGSKLKGDTLIIWIGTNDSAIDSEVNKRIIDIADNMIRFNGNDNYILIGLTSKIYCSNVEYVNKKLANHYGNKFLDIRKYLINYGLSDANITPTSNDNIDINNGEIPSSLRSDSVHLNDNGYSIVANQVYLKGKELGYW